MRDPSHPILAELDDHALIVLVAGASDQHPAATVLLLRHITWMQRRIAIDGNRLGLSLPDIEDAQQTLLPDIVPRAIASFRPGVLESGGSQSFKSFLRYVLRQRMRNFARHIRRAERHFDRSVDVYSVLELRHGKGRHGWFENPSRSAERHEFFECLERNLQSLRAAERLLWQMAVSRCSVGEIARVLNVQYHTAKRRRKRFLHKLCQRLDEHLEL